MFCFLCDSINNKNMNFLKVEALPNISDDSAES